jgi:hypothetical protein
MRDTTPWMRGYNALDEGYNALDEGYNALDEVCSPWMRYASPG